MSGKYLTNKSIGEGTVGPLGCEQYKELGAFAYDEFWGKYPSGGCWKVTGVRVDIGDTDSVHKGAERINWNFGVDRTQPCVACQNNLPGAIGYG